MFAPDATLLHPSTDPATAAVSPSQRVIELSRLADQVEAELLTALGAWDADQQWARDGALSAAAWLTHRSAQNRTTAQRRLAAARLAHAHQRTGEALATGEITTAHLAALARAAAGRRSRLYRGEHEEALLTAAARLTPTRFDTVARRWAHIADDQLDRDDRAQGHGQRNELHLSSTFEGRGAVDATLTAGGYATVKTCFEALTKPSGPDDQRPRPQRLGDALVDLCDAALRGHLADTLDPDSDNELQSDTDDDTGDPDPADQTDSPDARACRIARRTARAHIRTTIDIDTLLGRPPVDLLTARTDIDGIGPVPPEVIRQLLCDSPISRVLTRTGSHILDYGFARRLVSPAQRDALAVRDGGCVVDGCGRPPDWCDAHHLDPYRPGRNRGPTDLAGLALVCRPHHTLLHRNGWTLHRDPTTGTVTLQRE